MDDWTHRYLDDGPPGTQPELLEPGWRVFDVRPIRAQQAEAARVAGFEQSEAVGAVDPHADADVPLPFATPPGAAPTF